MRRSALAVLLTAALGSSGCDRLLALGVDAELAPPGDPGQAQVIDLRPRAEFAAGHLPGALSVPWVQLDAFLARGGVERGRSLLLASSDSTDAILAVPTARLQGYPARVLAGGVEGWRAAGLKLRRGPPPAEAGPEEPVRVELTRGQQMVAFLSGGVLKPTYMLLALLLVLWLRRVRSAPLRLLWHGLLWFFVGEAFCAVNFYVHAPGRVHSIDLLHGVGMVVMSTLIPWGLYRLIDERVLRFGDPEQRCQVQRLCGRCWKRERVRCAPHELMQLLVLALALVALMPLSGALRPTLFTTDVFGSPADYGVPIINHLVELRLYPLLGAALLLLTLLLLRGGPRSVRRAEPFFFLGFGLMTYPLLRFLLTGTFRDALWWSDLWEELTELIMLLAVGALLWLLRRQLGIARKPAGEADADAARVEQNS